MTGWAHVIASFRGQWLPGDPRGFRDHSHRIHSSGNHRRPPPTGEHAGLHRYATSISRGVVTPTREQCGRIGPALIEKLDRMDVDCKALVVTPTHAHALIRVGSQDAVRVFGRAKQFASHRVRDAVPGRLWGASCAVVRITDRRQFMNTRAYLDRHPAAWRFVRKRPETSGDLSLGV